MCDTNTTAYTTRQHLHHHPQTTSHHKHTSGGHQSRGSNCTMCTGATRQHVMTPWISVLLVLACMLLPLPVGATNRGRAKQTVNYEVWEQSDVGTLVGNIKQDARLNRDFNATVLATLTYTFLENSQNGHFFSLSETTGELRIAEEIDRDVICPQRVECELELDVAIKPIAYFAIIKLIVVVYDHNDNSPRFPQDHITHSISESTLPGPLFPIASAIDPDSPANGIRQYELRPETDKFELRVRNNSDGTMDLQLVLLQPVNREIQDFYQLRLMAFDGGATQLSGSVLIDVVVTDINDNNPEFINASYEIAVQETAAVNSTLLTVEALDPDSGPNGEISYGLASRTQSRYGDVFGIDPNTGQLYLKRALNAQAMSTYVLSVTAQDQGEDSLPTSVRVTIHVIDVNDHSPTIGINVLTDAGYAIVPEDDDVPYFVAYISVVDQDLGNNGIFNCTLDDNQDFSLVQLYDTEFKVEAIRSFDREARSEYRVIILCEDQGTPPLSSNAELVVKVGDRNDHAPRFLENMYMANMEENNNANEFIVQVSAVDSDSDANSQIEYQLEEAVWNLFNIDAGTGVITAAKSLDRETLSSVNFKVTAVDHGVPPQTATAIVLLTIEDQDDQVPRFKNRLYSFDIQENLPMGTEVGMVQATDGDASPHNQFRFSLLGGSDIKQLFTINAETGIISTLQALDREQRDVYHITAHVHSYQSVSRMNDTAEVIIHITDVNDNAPVIDFPRASNRTVAISNKVPPGYTVTEILAHDDDFSRNGRITYFISEGNEDGAFTIKDKTGEVFVNMDLSRHAYHEYRLVVMAQDDGIPQRLSPAVLYIQVNESIPYYPPRVGGVGGGSMQQIHLIIIVTIVFVAAILCLAIIVCICFQRKRNRCCSNKACETKSNGVRMTLTANDAPVGLPPCEHNLATTESPHHHHLHNHSTLERDAPPVYDYPDRSLERRQVIDMTGVVSSPTPSSAPVAAPGVGGVSGVYSNPAAHMGMGTHQHPHQHPHQHLQQHHQHHHNGHMAGGGRGVHESDDDDMSVSNSGSDNSKANMDTLSPANADKDTDSGCCADMSTFDHANLQLTDEKDRHSPNGSILKMNRGKPGVQQHRVPPTARQHSFSDWVLAEGQNLRQNGPVYRVAQTEAGRNKSVRFIDKNTPLTGDGDEEGAGGGYRDPRDVAIRTGTPAVLTAAGPSSASVSVRPVRMSSFSSQRPRQPGHVDTIPEEPENNPDTNSLRFIPRHSTPAHSPPPPTGGAAGGGGWNKNDGSLV